MSAENMYAIERDDASAEWFDAADEGRLLIRECAQGHRNPPQATICPTCGSTDMQWIEATGRGVIASYAVVHRRDAENLPLAIVELEEGPWLRTQVQDADPTELAVGRAVVVRFARPDGGEPLPYAVLA